MALRFGLKRASKHGGLGSTTSLISATRIASIQTNPYTHFKVSGSGKRHINTSGPLGLAPSSKLQAPSAPALVQESVDPNSYTYQPTARTQPTLRESRDTSPRTTHTPTIHTPTLHTPRKAIIQEQAAEIAEVKPEVKEKEEVNAEPSSSPEYWKKIPKWSDVPTEDFLRYSWQMAKSVLKKGELMDFLESVLPDHIPRDPQDVGKQTSHIKTRDDFIKDVEGGMQLAPMSVRLTPHVLSVIDWSNPLSDPIRRQFIPMKSSLLPDHPMLELDSLHESGDSPVPGLVHRYPDKALFLATSICPVYCRFCTRSYSVGQDTPSNTKKSFRPALRRWEMMFKYIEETPALTDIVVSGGDSYLLPAEHMTLIGDRLLSIPHIRRFRFATKGLAVCPSRILDDDDTWTDALVALSNRGKKLGKSISVHTHFNHPNEITWITRLATQKLFENGVMVRNQSVLLRGVNDQVEVMAKLIRDLADMNVQPYYVYQGDMVRGVEDLRTPLQTMLDMECQIRGSIAGFMTPQFVVDLPGGGGKRLAASKLTYDRKTGVSTFVAPAVNKKKGSGVDKVFKYYDPVWSLEK